MRRSLLLVVVDPEEIGVKDRLNNTRNNSNGIPVSVCKVPVNPVGDVQSTIQAKSKEVVSRNRLRFAGSLEHEQLRQNCDRFKPDRESPEHLHGRQQFISPTNTYT